MSRPAQAAPLHPVAAAVCGAVSIGMLLVLPVVGGPEAEPGLPPPPGSAGWWVVVAVLAAQALGVAWAGRFPAVVPPVLAAVALVLVWAAPGGTVSLGGVAGLAAVYLAVVSRPGPRTWAGLALTAAVVATGQFLDEVRAGAPDIAPAVVRAVLQGIIVVGLALLLGLVNAAQRDARRAREHEVLALRREQDALLQAAVSRERMAMSRELHDIAAHHMSGIALMAAAMDRQIDADPAAAKDSARQVRAQSRAVLDDLRRLVGLLREDADATRPVEGLDALAALVETRRAAGAEIDLVVPPGDLDHGLGPLARLVAHRMVQESLTNAAVHAPGARCVVEIGEPRDGRLAVTVRNAAPTGPDPGPGGGFGLLGMAERAQLVGADLSYGATADGGWEVRLVLPVEDPAPAPTTPPEDPA
ncbi:sensor histidine kinase [Pseudonocardia lacus]|uniref:sensor histidine kinase n=1 Tax=Pseudonocardia lacus TaxID=2835865 RepID=UPI001BDC7904|nr:histidine kinase [Pseudonocardia lacus]